jgi:hypothetical protein
MVYLVGAENDPALTFAFTMSVIAAAVGCIASVFGIILGCQKFPRKPSRFLDSSICYWDQRGCLLTLVAFASNECAGACSLDWWKIGNMCIRHLQYTVAGLSAFFLIKTFSQQQVGVTSDFGT